MGRKKRRWAKWRARREEKQTCASYGRLVAAAIWDEAAGEAKRVACNEALADHPTIQVKAFKGEGFEVGILGILNGIFGIADDGFGRIAAVYDTDSKRLTSFKQIR